MSVSRHRTSSDTRGPRRPGRRCCERDPKAWPNRPARSDQRMRHRVVRRRNHSESGRGQSGRGRLRVLRDRDALLSRGRDPRGRDQAPRQDRASRQDREARSRNRHPHHRRRCSYVHMPRPLRGAAGAREPCTTVCRVNARFHYIKRCAPEWPLRSAYPIHSVALQSSSTLEAYTNRAASMRSRRSCRGWPLSRSSQSSSVTARSNRIARSFTLRTVTTLSRSQ